MNLNYAHNNTNPCAHNTHNNTNPHVHTTNNDAVSTADGLSVELNVETEALMRVSAYARLEHMAPEVLLRCLIGFGLRSYEHLGIAGITADVSSGGLLI